MGGERKSRLYFFKKKVGGVFLPFTQPELMQENAYPLRGEPTTEKQKFTVYIFCMLANMTTFFRDRSRSPGRRSDRWSDRRSDYDRGSSR